MNNFNNYKVAACVVLYNPDYELYNNVKSYYDDVEIIYVIDNSEKFNYDLVKSLKSLEKVNYICNDGNIGIAAALNIACIKAKELNFDWILTMDQDSSFSKFKSYKDFLISKYYYSENVAVIAPIYEFTSSDLLKNEIIENEVYYVITSGSFLNLKLFNTVGMFNDELFIDEVDHEYCLRAIRCGYKIFQISGVFLNHSIGNDINGVVQHNFIRRYYITRNILYMCKNYKDICPRYGNKLVFKFLIKSLKRILKKEENKLLKLKSFFLGLFDFYRSRYGKRNF